MEFFKGIYNCNNLYILYVDNIVFSCFFMISGLKKTGFAVSFTKIFAPCDAYSGNSLRLTCNQFHIFEDIPHDLKDLLNSRGVSAYLCGRRNWVRA